MVARKLIMALIALAILVGCGTYAGSGAYAGATLGSILGSAIGGITGGARGSDLGQMLAWALELPSERQLANKQTRKSKNEVRKGANA